MQLLCAEFEFYLVYVLYHFTNEMYHVIYMKPGAPIGWPIPTNATFYKRDTYPYHVKPGLLANSYLEPSM